MIPYFKLADKILDKAKKKTPLKIAITASLCGDARAGKPNVSKAEKLFNEAMKQSSSPEIKELYSWFLISEERDEEVDSLDIDITSEISTRLRKSMIKHNKEFSSKKPTTKDQLADGKDLYYIGYKKYNDIRYLERAAETSFPIAQSEYAHFILKNEKKKEYIKALLYLQSSSENGIITFFILLDYMHHIGLEVKSNYHEALKNYTIAIENYEYQGYACFALAYCTGRGFDKDFCMTNRYITIAKNENTIFEKPFLIDYEMFITKEYKNKFEDIKVCSNINMIKASNAFLEATYYEFSKFEYQKAFN